MSRATEKAMDDLHSALAKLLTNELERASNRAESNPDDPAYAISPQLLSQAIKWLKDNNVSAPAGSKRVENLAAQLADLDLDDETLAAMTRN